MRILVTGGAGFIGSNFLNLMVPRHPEHHFINLDKLTYAANLASLEAICDAPNYTFVQADIADARQVDQVFDAHDPEWVFHFAAESHVDRSILGPAAFVQTNVIGTFVLLEACRARWQGRVGRLFHHVSTDEVYGSLGDTGAFTEETRYDPSSPYSASKAASDHFARAYHRTYGLPVKVTNCSNNYGPRQFPEKLIPLMILNALEGKPLPVYGQGTNVRDWLYVEDHCKALDLILHKGKPGEVYNIGGHNERTNLVVVKTIIGYLREHVDPGITEDLIAFVPDRKGHDFRYGIDPAKICNELGWRPETPFAEGIVRTIRWYLENRDWLARVTAGEYQEYYRRVYEER